jgi:hypothetical protein
LDNEANVSQLNTLLFSLLSSLSESEMMVKLERMKRGIQYNLAMENQEEVFLRLVIKLIRKNIML